jgi:uncharacterized protein (DUF1330 family)
MKGYVVANVAVNDPVAYEAYRSQTGAIIAQYGGRALVKGGALQVREGDPGLSRLVILEFPSVQAAAAFYDSPEYQAILPIRQAHAESSLCIVEGLD